MQDRRQLAFILAILGGVFALGTAVMMLAMSLVVFGALPGSGPGVVLALFAWLALTSAVGGILMLVAGVKLRTSTRELLQRSAKVTLAGGVVAVLGGNLLAAALGIVAGAILLGEEPTPATPGSPTQAQL